MHSHSQDELFLSLLLSEVSLLLSIPMRTQLITLPWTTMSPDGSWDESSLLIHTVVMMHRVCDGSMHRQSHVSAASHLKDCHTFTHLFSAKEIIFCMTLQVGHQVADLCQLMVLLVGKLTTGCSGQLMMVLITECSCPLAIGPTLGARVWLSWVLPSPYRGEACALGPQQQWTDNSKTVSLMLNNIYSLEG